MIVVFYIIQLKKTVKFKEQLLFGLLQSCILFLFLRVNFGRQTKEKRECLIHNYQRTLQVMTAAPQML